MDIEEFKKKTNQKRTSSLKKFEKEILELHDEHYSLKAIVEYLLINGINTSFQNVSRFINSHHKKHKSKVVGTQIVKPIQIKNDDVVKSNGLKLERKGKNLEIEEVPSWALD